MATATTYAERKRERDLVAPEDRRRYKFPPAERARLRGEVLDASRELIAAGVTPSEGRLAARIEGVRRTTLRRIRDELKREGLIAWDPKLGRGRDRGSPEPEADIAARIEEAHLLKAEAAVPTPPELRVVAHPWVRVGGRRTRA